MEKFNSLGARDIADIFKLAFSLIIYSIYNCDVFLV